MKPLVDDSINVSLYEGGYVSSTPRISKVTRYAIKVYLHTSKSSLKTEIYMRSSYFIRMCWFN
jgi:hypothetical protein